MNFGELLGLLIVTIIPMVVILYLAKRIFGFREKRLAIDAGNVAEKAAQYATSNALLEQRLRVVEQIVTDRGVDTAAQIEALRGPRLSAQGDIN